MMTPVSAPRRLGAGTSAGYASGSLVTGAFSTVPGLLLLPYLTDTLGVAAGVAGVLAFVPKAWAVLLNPVAGRVSDRSTARIGPRRPFVLGAGLGVGVAFALMFAGPFAAAAGAVWALLGYLLTATVFAFFQSPYTAMPAELTTDPGATTRLMSWRVAGIAVATLVSGAVAPAVVTAAGGGLPGYRAMGLAVGAIIAVGAVAAFLGTRRAPQPVADGSPADRTGLLAQLAVARADAPLRRLLTVAALQSAATGAQLAGVAYLARVVVGDPGVTTTLVVAFTAPALVVLPLLMRFGSRVDARRGALACSGASLLVSLGWLALPVLPAPVVLPVLAVALGSTNALQDTFVLAILSRCIVEGTARAGQRRAGLYAGLFSAFQGLGFAVGPLLFGLVLQLSGYVSSTTGTAAAQSDATGSGVLLGFAVLPAALTALSLPALRSPGVTPRPAA